MKFYEYQTKALFAQAGIPVPKGAVVRSTTDIDQAVAALGSESCVVKAQVLAGGRGKAGGIRFADNRGDIETAVTELLGKKLATIQTGTEGETIASLYLEQRADIADSLYLGLVVDRERQTITLIASAEGGVEIEEVAANQPEKIITAPIDPLGGYYDYIGRDVAVRLGLSGKMIGAFARMCGVLYRFFVANDAALLEINPLVVTGDGALIALDAKFSMDDSAAYRQKALAALYRKENLQVESHQEIAAKEIGVSYVSLDGNIGCMVNGAGLAMATMDIIKHFGGEPANFLDVGGSVTTDQVRDAFKLLTAHAKVAGILVNIFGGIVHCDKVAQGIVDAARDLKIEVPVVVRLQGTNVEQGRQILDSSGLNLTAAQTMEEAAKAIDERVDATGSGKAGA